MEYYDLIDTLITVPDVSNYSTYLANLPRARVKYRPRGPFAIITSQPLAAKTKVNQLIRDLFPNCSKIYQVQGTSGKINTLTRLGADNYTDNDPQVRAAIARKLPDLDLYRISGGSKQKAN